MNWDLVLDMQSSIGEHLITQEQAQLLKGLNIDAYASKKVVQPVDGYYVYYKTVGQGSRFRYEKGPNRDDIYYQSDADYVNLAYLSDQKKGFIRNDAGIYYFNGNDIHFYDSEAVHYLTEVVHFENVEDPFIESHYAENGLRPDRKMVLANDKDAFTVMLHLAGNDNELGSYLMPEEDTKQI